MALPPSPLAMFDSLRNPYFSTIYLPHPSHHKQSSTSTSTSTHPSHTANSSYSTNTTTSTQSSYPLSDHLPYYHLHPSQTVHHLSNYLPHIPHPHLHQRHQAPIQTTIITTPSSQYPHPSHHLYASHHPQHSTADPLSLSTPSTPPLTIHETRTTYLFTFDVPGLTSRASITLHWKTPHVLSVSGSTPPSIFSFPPPPFSNPSPPPSTNAATATTSPTSTHFTQDHEDEPPSILSPPQSVPHSPTFPISPTHDDPPTKSPTDTQFTHEDTDLSPSNSLVRVDSHDDPGMTACAHIAATNTRGPNPYPKYCSSLSESLYRCSVVSPPVSPTGRRKGEREGKVGNGSQEGNVENGWDEEKEWKGGGGESRLLLEERRTGPWERAFSFAVGVEREGVRARLEAGVLRIWVPKKGDDCTERTEGGCRGGEGGSVTWVD